MKKHKNMKGYIYKIWSVSEPQVYFGSTTQELCNRMSGHRADYKRFLNDKMHYITSFELMKLDDAKIELVRVIEFEHKAELRAAEGQCIRENECVNRCQAGRNHAQWVLDNAKYMKDYRHEKYIANSEHVRAERKKYYAANSAAILIKDKAYRAATAEHIYERTHRKFDCECGGKFTCKKARHIRTKKHTDWLKEQKI